MKRKIFSSAFDLAEEIIRKWSRHGISVWQCYVPLFPKSALVILKTYWFLKEHIKLCFQFVRIVAVFVFFCFVIWNDVNPRPSFTVCFFNYSCMKTSLLFPVAILSFPYPSLDLKLISFFFFFFFKFKNLPKVIIFLSEVVSWIETQNDDHEPNH